MAMLGELLLVPLLLAPASPAIPDRFDKVFVGSLGGKYEVRVSLTRDAGALSGRYSYRAVEGSLLGLSGSIESDGRFRLEEFDSGKKTGRLEGRLEGKPGGGSLLQLAGHWSKPDGSQRLAFTLVEEHLDLPGGAVTCATARIDEEEPALGYKIAVSYPRLEGAGREVLDGFQREVDGFVQRRVAEFRKEAREWARDQRPSPPPPGDAGGDPTGTELAIEYEVLAAAHGLVSVRFSEFSYFAGSAHPSHGVDVLNYSFAERKRLTLADLFKPGSRYLQALEKRCRRALEPAEEGVLSNGFAPTPENYALWNVTSRGLLVNFAEYQVGPYVAGMPQVLVPYAELRPLLRANGPLSPFLK